MYGKQYRAGVVEWAGQQYAEQTGYQPAHHNPYTSFQQVSTEHCQWVCGYATFHAKTTASVHMPMSVLQVGQMYGGGPNHRTQERVILVKNEPQVEVSPGILMRSPDSMPGSPHV